MYVNLLVWVVSMAIVSERLFVLLFRLRINEKTFLAAVEKLVMAGNFDRRAIKLCTSQEGAAVPPRRPQRTGLRAARRLRRRLGDRRGRGRGSCRRSPRRAGDPVGDREPRDPHRPRRHGVRPDPVVRGPSARRRPDQKSILLTQGIAHAMANTFFGLGIAVQCVFFHMMLSIVTKNLLDSVDLSAVKIENILTRRRIAAGGRETGQPAPG
jgi:biopolymer transport protein ExbB